MKTIACLLILALCGCATVNDYATPSSVRTATALACSNTIMFGVAEADRIEAAQYVFAVARAIRSLAGGNVPTAAELKAAIHAFTPADGKWTILATNIASIYAAIYPRIQGNGALALEYLEAVAAGCEDAASAFLPSSP